MSVTYRHLIPALLTVAALLPLACGDSTGPTGGSITVGVTTTGATEDLDPNGYTLTIDGGPTPSIIGINGSLKIEDLAAGTHIVRLDGLAPNCTVSGVNPVTLNLADGANAQIGFPVKCAPRLGTIRVTTTTTGTEVDTDGYVVLVYGFGNGTIAANGTRDFTNVPPGPRTVALSGVAGNCTVSGANTRSISIPSGATVDVAFVIQCVASGAVAVTTTTTGVSPDLNGYYIFLRPVAGGFGSGAPVGSNGTALLSRLLPGTYEVFSYDIAANCDASTPNPGTITVTVGSPTPLRIDVTCETPRQLVFVNRSGAAAEIYLGVSAGGNVTQLTFSPSEDNEPAWSPNGARIAFVSDRDGNSEIYVMNADGTNPVRLTNDLAFDADPAWSPDGTRIAFKSERGGLSGIWVMRTDGAGLTRLTSNSRPDAQPSWSPDGSRIALSRGVETGRDIYIVNSDGSGLTPLTRGMEAATDPAWSPDGRRIAISSISYYYDPEIVIFSLNGISYAPPTTLSPASDPAWRP